MNGQQHIHFIGICGVAMSAIAIAFKKNGWKVTGSDVGFYPPISTHLEENEINFYSGWHPEKMGTPDLVVVGNVAGSFNPEWLHVKEKKLTHKSYPEIIADYLIKTESVVCAGTYGKTTTTALLSWIFLNSKKNPSFMFGGLSQNHIPAAQITESDFSIVEGDEYKSARWDLRPKFSHYEPKHLLLTAVEWDHADIYKTEKDYFLAFQKLVNNLPQDGTFIVSERVNHIDLPKRKICYGQSKDCLYRYGEITHTENGISFNIYKRNEVYKVESSCFGEYMADNITACFAMAMELDLPANEILQSISSFKGMKRRLEKRFEGAVKVFDDIAHSPAKAKNVLKTLKQIFNGKIVAVFEPNTGNRRPEAIPGYDEAFSDANEVVIPRLTKIKEDLSAEKPLYGEQLATVISQTQPKTIYIEDDNKLVSYLQSKTEPGTIIVFMGSHGFRGMIEETIRGLK